MGSNSLVEKLLFENLQEEELSRIIKPTVNNLHKFAIDYADALVLASPVIDKDVLSHIKSSGKPFMQYPGDENYINSYQNFYQQFFSESEDCAEIAEESEEIVLTEN